MTMARAVSAGLLAGLWLVLGGDARAAEPAAAASAARVERFTPTGAADRIGQATARFSAPMVALGDASLPDPFDLACAGAGAGRWIDPRNWVFDFDAQLPAGERCRFTVRRGLRDLAGAPVAAASFEFTTGGPAIEQVFPFEGSGQVDERQVFALRLAAPATALSMRTAARCIVEGIGEEIPVEVLEGEARAELLGARNRLGYGFRRLLAREGAAAVDEARLALVRCQRPLPPGARMQLAWGAGVQTASGVAVGAEKRLAFQVRPAFLAQVECTRANADAGCLPMLPIQLRFTAPVPREQALAARLMLGDGRQLQPQVDEQGDGAVQTLKFAPPFPESRPAQLRLPAGLVDDAGRALGNAQRFPLDVRVDAFPPLAKFAGPFGILESREGGVLPVTIRSLEPQVLARSVEMPARLVRVDADPARIAGWIRRVQEAGEHRGEFLPAEGDDVGGDGDGGGGGRWREDTGNRSVFGASDGARAMMLPRPGDAAATQVVGIPLRQPGFYVVEIESRILGRSLLGRDESRFVATSALVTDLAVHFKWGRESSLAWVTQLHDGAPAAGAELVIANWCDGKELWKGTTDAQGLAHVPRTLGQPHDGTGCGYAPMSPLMVLARRGGDFSFTQTGWGQGLQPEDFGLQRAWGEPSGLHHTVLDRALFRAGETVSMKHFLRRATSAGIAVADPAAGTRSFVIRHEGSGQEYAFTAQFGADGIAESSWRIPAEARLGEYRLVMKEGEREHQTARFQVEQFRLPTMRAGITGPPRPLVAPRAAEVDVHVAWLSGGGASNLPVRLRARVRPQPVQFDDYRDFVFGGRAVEEGVVDESDRGLDFEAEADGAQGAPPRLIPVTLDRAGAARVAIDALPPLDGPARLDVELEYQDANGETLTTGTGIRLVPSTLHVGLRREGWVGTAEQLRFRAVVLDLDGKPQANRKVAVTLYHAQRHSIRKRLVGGFYAYETSRETTRLAARCDGTTDAQGLVACEVAPRATGEVLMRAEVVDDAGRTAGATVSAWVYDGDEAWFGGTAGDRMDVLPERKSYEAGDVARFQVRLPFRQANALVTVEREGVISGFVTRLDARRPTVEVPIADAHAPNVFVSVLAVRGRVSRPEPAPGSSRRPPRREWTTGLVDLNKPAYRLGMAAIRVGWKPHRLDVRLSTDRDVFRIRERARLDVRVAREDGRPLPPGTEVAIAAVDAALLDLAPNRSWDLLTAMMGERDVEVLSSTAQTQVVGRRHYGRKAVLAGGGGGRDPARELFDTLLFWRARVAVDAEGRATVEIPLNDSLTEFRLVAVAHGGADLFGTGETRITTTQDVILTSGLPPLVREGDEYLATVSLRNTTQGALSLDVDGARTAAGRPAQPLVQQRIDLAAGESRDVSWRVTAPTGAREQVFEVRARRAGSTDAQGGDLLRVRGEILPAVPVRTRQATLVQVDGTGAFDVARPAGALPGRGAIEVSLRARLGEQLDGVREYMQRYPYQCLEQQASRSIALGDAAAWSTLMSRLPAWLDRDGLARFFASEALPGEDVLTAWLLSIADEAGLEIPEASRDRMLAGLQGFVEGRIRRASALPTADLAIRKLAAIEALSRHGRASPAMLTSLDLQPRLWPTSAVIDWLSILRRVEGIPRATERRREAEALLRARLNLQGSAMVLSAERRDALPWLLVTPDVNANRLLLAVHDLAGWREDVPRLVQGSLGRQRAGRWDTTVGNAWGTVALRKFSARFESTPVAGRTRISQGASTRQVDWSARSQAREASLPWPAGEGTVQLVHEGAGRPWALVRTTAAVPPRAPVSAGYRIERSVAAVEQRTPGRWSRGDVARVRLAITAQADATWVVVDDPVPGGATILGSGLGGQSELLRQGERRSGSAWLAFEERRFEGYRAFYRYVPRGTFTVEYTVRLDNPGTFNLPASRVESMYAPEVHGELPLPVLTVER